jgi:hypothetical protein
MEEIKNDSLKMSGWVKITHYDEQGNIKASHEDHNLVVTVGKNAVATQLAASSPTGGFMKYVGIGTGTTSPAITDTALQTELSGGGYSRQIGTLSSSTNTYTNTVTFAAGVGTGAITEAGLFSASTSGTMLAHIVFSVYNVQSGDTFGLVWNISFN